MTDYQKFLQSKKQIAISSGFEKPKDQMCADMFEWQKDIVYADERHICPLQLPVIERGIELWSNPGDVVLDPFNGIGSTGYQALLMGRKYIGIELKESYYNVALKNLQTAEETSSIEQESLFDI